MSGFPDDYDTRVRAVIDENGWAVQGVVGDGPALCYTVGLVGRFGHPELVIVGVAPEVGQSLLNTIARRVADGAVLADGDELVEVANLPLHLSAVAEPQARKWLLTASRFAGNRRLTALQVLWPDAEGRARTDAEFDPSMRAAQPLIDEVDPPDEPG